MTGTSPAPPFFAHRLSRPVPMDREPGARLDQALLLLDGLDRVVTHLQPLKRTVERLTGRPLAQALTRILLSGTTTPPWRRHAPPRHWPPSPAGLQRIRLASL